MSFFSSDTSRTIPASVSSQKDTKKNNFFFVIVSTSVGTLIEWYDLILAIMLAPVLSRNLFPESGTRFLETLAIVVTSYLIRPIGSLISEASATPLAGKSHSCIHYC